MRSFPSHFTSANLFSAALLLSTCAWLGACGHTSSMAVKEREPQLTDSETHGFVQRVDYVGGVETESALPSDPRSQLGYEDMLRIMQWQAPKRDSRTYDLGGTKSPSNAAEALTWIASHPTLPPARSFLAAYKAISTSKTCEQAAQLLGEMLRAKVYTSLVHSDRHQSLLAVMALGIAVATLQCELFEPGVVCEYDGDLCGAHTRDGRTGMDLIMSDTVSPAKLAAIASFAEAISVFWTRHWDNPHEERAVTYALRSFWKQCQLHDAVAEAARRILRPKDQAWLDGQIR